MVVYGIWNRFNEYNSGFVKFFLTLEEAKEGLKTCADWWCPNGTGRIYKIELDANNLIEHRNLKCCLVNEDGVDIESTDFDSIYLRVL